MKTEFQQNLVAKIKKLREEKGLRQADMAKCLGVSPGHIGNVESYKYDHKYTLKQLSTICKFLDYSLPMLLCEQEEPNYADFIDSLVRYLENNND